MHAYGVELRVFQQVGLEAKFCGFKNSLMNLLSCFSCSLLHEDLVFSVNIFRTCVLVKYFVGDVYTIVHIEYTVRLTRLLAYHFVCWKHLLLPSQIKSPTFLFMTSQIKSPI